MDQQQPLPVQDLPLSACIAKIEAGALLIDVRNQDEWEAGHAPGARFLPLPRLKENTREAIAEIQKWLAERAGDDNDPEVVVVCRSGQRSHKAAEILGSQGIVACNLAGGMKAWSEAGLEMVSESGDEPKVI